MPQLKKDIAPTTFHAEIHGDFMLLLHLETDLGNFVWEMVKVEESRIKQNLRRKRVKKYYEKYQ